MISGFTFMLLLYDFEDVLSMGHPMSASHKFKHFANLEKVSHGWIIIIFIQDSLETPLTYP